MENLFLMITLVVLFIFVGITIYKGSIERKKKKALKELRFKRRSEMVRKMNQRIRDRIDEENGTGKNKKKMLSQAS